jgi:hypothetical protein
MSRPETDLIIINGVPVPAPDAGYKILETTNVNAGRNANGVVVGQVVGRNIWKIDGLSWGQLTPEQWKSLKQALKPFYVPVTFTDDYNERRTLIMYPGDRESMPYHVENLSFRAFKECKFNLIDTGR